MLVWALIIFASTAEATLYLCFDAGSECYKDSDCCERCCVRNKCIPDSDCASSRHPESCETMTCPEGQTCHQETVLCKRAPCPQPWPYCTTTEPPTDCSQVTCAEGLQCNQIAVDCIPEVPCPQPSPFCDAP